MLRQHFQSILSTKGGKAGLTLFAVFILYICLFATNSKDYTFGIVGGYVGAVCSLIVMCDIYFRRHNGATFQLLLWRAFCDFGIALRFILIPAFNWYICNDKDCHRENSNENLCPVPGAFLEFFILASESWFLCSGLDLIFSVTNPFSRFEPRLKYYHLFTWTTSSLITFFPFFINQYKAVYGWWYVSSEIDDQAFCWLKIQSENVLGPPMTIFFFVPLNVVYGINLLALFIAYSRLRKGLNRSFLPRLKILVSSAVHVFVLMLFWFFFLMTYAWAFYNRANRTYNGGMFAMVNCIIASKGVSCFVTWILTTHDQNMKNFVGEEGKVEDNIALREEVLNFATAGIRSTARAGPTVTPDKVVLVRRPQMSSADSQSNNVVTPYFFLKFMLGESHEFATIENIISNKRRSVDDHFVRQTVSNQSLAQAQAQAPRPSSDASARFSQRATLPSGSRESIMDRKPFENAEEADEENHVERATEQEHADNLSEAQRRSSDMIALEELKEIRKRSFLRSSAETISTYLMLNSDAVEFYEYQPFHFRRVRLAYGVTDEVYINAFSTTIKERLTDGGASGAFFFFSKGEKLIAKSCNADDFEALVSIAVSYADYVEANRKTYISKIFGAYELRIYGISLFFFVMNNLFYNREMVTMNEKYDIKGSWVSRNATPPVDGQSVTCSYCEQHYTYRKGKKVRNQTESLQRSLSSTSSNNGFPATESGKGREERTNTLLSVANPTAIFAKSKLFSGTAAPVAESQCPYTVSGQHSPNVILKDNDIKYKIRLPPDTAVQLLQQIRKDADFLDSMRIMDYSLLVGVHNAEYDVDALRRRTKSKLTTASQSSVSSLTGSGRIQEVSSKPSREGNGLQTSSGDSGEDNNARNVSNQRGSGETDSLLGSAPGEVKYLNPNKIDVMRVVGPDSYFIGIIDFQQRWTVKKKIERFFKINFNGADPRGLSAIEPTQYKERFLRKIEDILDLEDVYKVVALPAALKSSGASDSGRDDSSDSQQQKDSSSDKRKSDFMSFEINSPLHRE